jgi:hypothetical protein
MGQIDLTVNQTDGTSMAQISKHKLIFSAMHVKREANWRAQNLQMCLRKCRARCYFDV